MADTIFVRGEGGSIFEMDLPLSEPIQQRFDAGRIVRVNPDGSPYIEGEPAPAAPHEAHKPRRKAHAKPTTESEEG